MNRQISFNKRVFFLPDTIPDIDQYLHQIIGVQGSFIIVKSQNPWETIEKSTLPFITEPVTILSLDNVDEDKAVYCDQASVFSIEYLLQQPEEKMWYFLMQSKTKTEWQQQVDRFLNTCDTITNLKFIQKFLDFLDWVHLHQVTFSRLQEVDILLIQQWIIKIASISPTLPLRFQHQVQKLSHWVFNTLIEDVKYNDKYDEND